MKSKVAFLAVLGASIIALIFALGSTQQAEIYFASPEKVSSQQDYTDKIELIIKTLPLEKKIGQMMVVGFKNPYFDDHIKEMIDVYGVGGVNLLARNVNDREGVIKMISDLKLHSEIPLFIATDQEGGDYVRFKFLSELTPQMEIKSIEEARRIAKRRGEELCELGINMNFSPVIDYVNNPQAYLFKSKRVFEATPELIGKLGQAMIEGYREADIIAVPKHFPGYGNGTLDPHTNFAVSSGGDEFEKWLVPFQYVIGQAHPEVLMTAHVVVKEIDDVPATLSPVFLIEILRGQLKYEGVIITDDLEMASTGDLPIGQLVIQAINAGADMIISTLTISKHKGIVEAVRQAVLENKINEKRIDESLRRILKLKFERLN